MTFFFAHVSDDSRFYFFLRKKKIREKNLGKKKVQTFSCSDGIQPLKPPGSWGFRPQTPDTFGVNPPSQMVIGCYWLAFLNQFRKNLLSQKLKIKKFVWCKNSMKSENCFCIRFRVLRIIWNKKKLTIIGGGSECRSLGQGQLFFMIP